MNERVAEIFKTSLVGIGVNILLSIFKAIIGWLSNSIAITMDAVNNLTDAISSIITIVGTRLAGKDPNKKHPFGYGRIEYLSTLAIAIIILYAGVTALVESVKGIISPELPSYNTIMLIVIAVAVAAKVFLGLFFRAKGKKTSSGALEASGKDALFDALISTATIIAAVIYMIFEISLEAYLGVIISILILKSGFEIVGETVSQLLGEGASVELVKAVKKTIVRHEGVKGAYDLVFNNYGQDVYLASVHIEIDDTLTANEIDILTRHIMDDVRNEHNVILTAIGIYSHNTKNQEIVELRNAVTRIVTSHEHVNQVHGFYASFEEKIIRFDMVISFNAKSRSDVYDAVLKDLKNAYPDYEISAGMDMDFNEI